MIDVLKTKFCVSHTASTERKSYQVFFNDYIYDFKNITVCSSDAINISLSICDIR